MNEYINACRLPPAACRPPPTAGRWALGARRGIDSLNAPSTPARVSYLSPRSCNQWLAILRAGGRSDDRVAFEVERDGPDV